MNEKRLYRSCNNRILGGVCGGLGEYFDIDPVLIRLIFVLLTFVAAGIVIYLIAWVVIPEDPECVGKNQKTKEEIRDGAEEIKEKAKEFASEIKKSVKEIRKNRGDNDGRLIAGIIVIALGVIFLLQNVVHINIFANLWPIILIIIGLVFLTGSSKR